jgi:hypothetical protein
MILPDTGEFDGIARCFIARLSQTLPSSAVAPSPPASAGKATGKK